MAEDQKDAEAAYRMQEERRRMDGEILQEARRPQAAIDLRMPDSGNAHLDAMILEARRMDYAAAALTGLLAAQVPVIGDLLIAEHAWHAANCMLAELQKRREGGENANA